MSDKLEYRFGDQAVSGDSSLEISTTKEFIDGVTARRGPMLDELRQPPTKKILLRERTDDGGVVIGFNLDALGRGYSGQPEERASRAMAILSQIEGVALQNGQSDPRMRLTNSDGDGSANYHDAMISFERPASADDEELASKIQTGMLRAAQLLRYFYNQVEDRKGVWVTHKADEGFTLNVGHPVFLSHPDHPQVGERVELLSTYAFPRWSRNREDHARLVALTGIVSVLGPLGTNEQGATAHE